MGLLIKAEKEWIEGQEVGALLGITKYEPPPDASTYGDNEKDHGQAIIYDIEGFRRYPELIKEGEEVWITEKIHGCNARYMYYQDRLWCGSRTAWKKEADKARTDQEAV